MKRFLLIAGLVLAIGGVVVLFGRRGGDAVKPALPRDASLLLVGFTNLPSGSFAVFCLTNGTKAHFACVPRALEEFRGSVWVPTALTGPASRQLRNWIGLREELKPGEAFTFMVPPPTTNETWRVVFMCQEQMPLIDPGTDLARHLTDTKAVKSDLRQFSGRMYFVTSPAIGQ